MIDEPCVCDTAFTCLADFHLDDTQEIPLVEADYPPEVPR